MKDDYDDERPYGDDDFDDLEEGVEKDYGDLDDYEPEDDVHELGTDGLSWGDGDDDDGGWAYDDQDDGDSPDDWGYDDDDNDRYDDY